MAPPTSDSGAPPAGGGGSVKLPGAMHVGSGSAYESVTDLAMPAYGPGWIHARTFNSLTAADSVQGHGWRHSQMMEIEELDATHLRVIVDAYDDLTFTYDNGTSTWTTDHYRNYELTHDSGNYRYILEADDGRQWRFRDFDYATAAERGTFYEIRDANGNTLALTYSSGKLDRVDDAADHRAKYSYFASGDNSGKLQTIKLYNAQTESSANLIAQVDYAYYSSSNNNGGQIGDLQLVTVRKRATSDADGTLSMVWRTHYRYWDGTYNETTNPGTDHKLKYVLRPENFVRLVEAELEPDAYFYVTDTVLADYANLYFEYDANYRVSRIEERSGSCTSCGSGSGGVGTTTFTWAVNGTAPSTYNDWVLHCDATLDNGAHIFLDTNTVERKLANVFKDTTGSKWITQYVYTPHNRLALEFSPTACTAYSETADYAVTTTSGGRIRAYEYFGAGDYADYLKAEYDTDSNGVAVGTNGVSTGIKLVAYGRTESSRPDLVTSVTRYVDTGATISNTTSHAYTFHSGTKAIQQITTTHPSVDSTQHGPGVSALVKQYLDDHGHLRWAQDGEGYVTYHGYDDDSTGELGTGRRNLTVQDVDTQTLPAAITGDWSGAAPFSRSDTTSTALNITTSKLIDFLGRVRKSIDAEGVVTWYVYKKNETRIHPAWQTNTTLTPSQVTRTDEEGKVEQSIALKTSVTFNVDTGAPTGTDTLLQSNYASWSTSAYSDAGTRMWTRQYHAIPTSGAGSRYANYYQTTFTYTDMGQVEATIEDVADDTSYDVEQVTKMVYDELGRVIQMQSGVSDSSHDASAGDLTGLTLTQLSATYYDDPDPSDGTLVSGVGNGNVTGVAHYYGSGQYTASRSLYDWRGRRAVSINPDGSASLVQYDNLGRVTAAGTFSSTNGLDPGDDPADSGLANDRLSLSKTYFDTVGRVYKTERFLDPTDPTPEDELASNTYYDRRGQVWATDAANTGVQFTQYDGAGRRVASLTGTQFNPSGKYDGNDAPVYPGDDQGLIEHTAYTLSAGGDVEKTVRKTLVHTDANGLDLDGSDFIATYVFNWYDDAGRLTDTANYGTNDTNFQSGSAPTYGASAPARSDTVLVTSHSYNSAGRREQVTDPKGIVAYTRYNDLGQTIEKVEDYGTGKLNRSTQYQYNGQGSLVRIMADPGDDNTYANGVWTISGSDVDQVTEYGYTDSTSARRVTETRFPTGDGTVGSASTDKLVFTYRQDGKLLTRTDQNGNVITWTYDTMGRKETEKVTTLGDGVDDAVRAVKWEYADGRVDKITAYSDTALTTVVNQIDNDYDAAGALTEQKQEPDGAVDGNTKSVKFNYAYDGANNRHRLKYTEYPDGTRIFKGYTHTDTANTFQDEINAVFGRVGQLALEDDQTAGSIGDVLAEYDYVGMGRFVGRRHSGGTGLAGNDTKLDLWHGTAGEYAGLDRFGRVADMQYVDYTGHSAVDFDQRVYSYDRNGNPTAIDNPVHTIHAQSFAYDDLNRLIERKEGVMLSGAIGTSSKKLDYNMDLLGNLVASAGGFKQNSAAITFSYAVNATNEITSIARSNPAGEAKAVVDDFSTDLIGSYAGWSMDTDLWHEDANGSWAVSSGKVTVSSIAGTPGYAILDGRNSGEGAYQVKITLPASGRAGLLFCQGDANLRTPPKWGVDIAVGSTDNVQLISNLASGGTVVATASASISASTEYLVRVIRKQRHIEARVFNAAGTTELAAIAYDATADLGVGRFGLYAFTNSTQFDDFKVTPVIEQGSVVPHWSGTANATYDSVNERLEVVSAAWGGQTVLEWAGDDEYIVQADVRLNGGSWADLGFFYADPDNYCAARIDDNDKVTLIQVVRGEESALAQASYTPATSVTVKVAVSGSHVTIWVAGTEAISDTLTGVIGGTVALAGEKAVFDDIKVGYDNNSDGDLDDTGDALVLRESFADTDITPTHDDNGNLTFDGTYTFTYDAWNRLVEAKLDVDGHADVVVQAAEYDGLGRRIQKTVTHSGDLDGAFTYLYNGNQIIEVRNGADDVELLVVHGTRYIDEIVCQRAKDRGWAYVHQDANWNVTALTAMNGAVIERYWYKPYGEFVASAEFGWFDYDQDGDVDSADAAVAGLGGACLGSSSQACQAMDADGDRDVDSADYAIINAYVSTLTSDTKLQRVPAAPSSRRGNLFAHQGLLFDAEIASFQNRARQYDPKMRRFMQRDPLGRGLLELENTPPTLYFATCDRWGQRCRTRTIETLQIKPTMVSSGSDMDLYVPVRSSPLAFVDSLGLSARCSGANGKSLTCGCRSGPREWEVRGDSARARAILPGDGCVTLLFPKGIFCTKPCGTIKNWSSGGPGPSVPIFEHECCHACAFEDGWLFCYLPSWIPGDLTGHCNRNPKPATIHW